MASLHELAEVGEHAWLLLLDPQTNAAHGVVRAYLAAVVMLDGHDRLGGKRLLDGLAGVASRYRLALRGVPLGDHWSGLARELGRAVEIALPDGDQRAAFADEMRRRGHPLHLVAE